MTPTPLAAWDRMILHPALSGVISLLFVCGLHQLSLVLCRRYLRRPPSFAETFCLAVILMGAWGSLVSIGVRVGSFNPWILRAVGAPIVLAGAITAPRAMSALGTILREFARQLSASTWPQRLALATVAIIATAMLLGAFAPPTDGDSIAYHFGVPFDILRRGHWEYHWDWGGQRLLGSGEYINLLGLCLYTDNLGVFVQLYGLTALLSCISDISPEARRPFLLMMTIGLPPLLFLASAQKPQLIGVAAVIAAVLILQREEPRRTRLYALAVGALFSAMSVKYSFYLTGGLALLYVWLEARRSGCGWACFGIASICYCLMLLPTHAMNGLVYGDPLSPLLSGALGSADPIANELARGLREYDAGGFIFPLRLFVSDSLGAISAPVGLALLAPLMIRRWDRGSASLVLLAGAMVLAVSLLGQRTGRFFLEPALLGLAAVAIAPELRASFRRLSALGFVQTAPIVGSWIAGAYLLFPGALGWDSRHGVLRQRAGEYQAMEELDRALPPDAFVFSELRGAAFLPRPGIQVGVPENLDYRYQGAEATIRVQRASGHRMFLATNQPPSQDHLLSRWLEPEPVLDTQVPLGTRNPINDRKMPLLLFQIHGADQ